MGWRRNIVSSVMVILLAASQAQAQTTAYDEGLVAYSGGDYKKALADFSVAAEQGDGGAAHLLATMYRQGLGVGVDMAVAAKWLTSAAGQGIAQAQYELAELLRSDALGKPDYAGAVLWYHRAAQQSHPLAIYQLATLYSKGLGVEQNAEQGRQFYVKAASELDIYAQKGDARSQNILARMYEQGLGVARDMGQALRFYRLAANQGWPEAELSMARLYARGLGVARDRETALKWVRQAAAHGSQQAQRALAADKLIDADLASLD